jgi:GT2 family glycosyltransferase
MKVFVGIPTYNRAQIFNRCIRFFANSRLIHGFIIVIQATTIDEAEKYNKAIKEIKDIGFETLYILRHNRMGSTRARNKIFEIAIDSLTKNDILIMYDDDFIYPGDYTIGPILKWLTYNSVGMVGGKVINLQRRRIDPDFSLNIANIADKLTELTGFIILNTKYGPRETNYTSHPLALRIEILHKGIRYDEKYRGIGYREESDLQRQVKAMDYKIIFEPRFFAYHLAVEVGGNRYSDIEDRMYWKWKNHMYFMNKWHYPIYKKIFSYIILTTYALINGPLAVKGIIKAVRS